MNDISQALLVDFSKVFQNQQKTCSNFENKWYLNFRAKNRPYIQKNDKYIKY